MSFLGRLHQIGLIKIFTTILCKKQTKTGIAQYIMSETMSSGLYVKLESLDLIFLIANFRGI